MRNFKKWIALLLTIAMLVSFTACATDAPAELPSQTETDTQTHETESEVAEFKSESESESTTEEEPQPQKAPIRNLILIIGDGMGPEHIAAGQLASGAVYPFTDWQNTNVNTDSVSKDGLAGVMTDSAASATALATGFLTVNGYLGMDRNARQLDTILDLAKASGKATGIVTTDYLYGATPSGFSAHSPSRTDYDRITRTQAQSGVDFLCGLRKDSHYLSYQSQITSGGYYFANTAEGLRNAPKGAEKLYLTLNIENSQADSLPLCTVASMALSFLEHDEDGFVLIIEQAHIDKHSHNNEINGVVSAMNSLALTVETVME